MIPEATIDQIREASDIVQVIAEYLRLKKRGKNHLALCPFHTEKTPSFNVNSERQIFHCFGCGKGGNVFTFLMEHEKMSFVEAVRHLARRANIPIVEDRRSDQRREHLERLNFANQIAVEYFGRVLHEKRYATVLNDYLKGRRDISEEMIETFQLGLAGSEWDGLIKYATRKDLTPDELMQAGLVLKSETKGNYFDRFRQRLMFPIVSLSQKPIAFGGRTLKKGEPAKYLNSPETPLYNKSNVLYGLSLARDYIRTDGTAYVVEGYFDVISLVQVGVGNVVASSGTAFTEQQARLLARFTDEVCLFFDADSAGQNAALRSVDALYDAGLEVRVIVPPDGEDPDSVARKTGRDGIEELRDAALGYIPFRMRDVRSRDLGIIGKEKLVKELASVASRIGDATRRNLFISEAADVLDVAPELLRTNVTATPIPETARPGVRTTGNAREYDLLTILFLNPQGAGDILQEIAPDDFDSRSLARVYAAVAQQFREVGKIDAAALIASAEDSDFASLITEIAAREWDAKSVDQGLVEITGAIKAAKRSRLIARLRHELADAEKTGDQDRAQMLTREIDGLTSS